MNYTYPVEEYKKQLQAYMELEKLAFTPEDSKEYVIEKLEERSAKKRAIADVANTMIREYIETFEKDPEAMTEADAEALDAFSELLYPDGSITMDVTVPDYGILYRIEKLMAAHYKRTGDLNRYVLALNRCSLGHMLLINGHAFTIQNAIYRDECVELAARLDEDVFDEKARSKIMVLLCRETLTGPETFSADYFRYVIDTLRKYTSDPPTAYETRNLLFFCSLIFQMFREHCIYMREHGLEVDREAARPVLTDTAAILRDLMDRNPGIDTNGELALFLLTVDFLLGDVPVETLLDKVTELQKAAFEYENTLHQTQALGVFNNVYLMMLYWYSPLPREEIVRLSRERVREVLPKLLNVTRMVNNVVFNRHILEFLYAASLTGSFDEFADIILESTVYADKALYIHTEMVREMSLAIFDYMIDRTPEVFDGVAGRDTAYIRTHKDEMRRLLSECCMFHDIGKFFLLDIVENSMRRLTDDEFGLIREHPGHFTDIYRIIDDKDERVLCIRDCAMTHHLWHDGTRGYPDVSHTKNRPFADILAIADSIDAATDFLGRPYHSRKTLDELIAEIQETAGTRYGPEAADVLNAPEVRDRLLYLTTEGRKDVNYRIYAFNKF